MFTGTRRCPMPWSTPSAMTQRLLFIRDYELGVFSFTELCARYGISRETGYVTLARYRQDGRAGLSDRSRRPHHSPRQTAAPLIDQLVEVRRQHPDWGPKKLLWQLQRHAPETPWPSPSTAGLWLQRRGPTPGRRSVPRPGHPLWPQATPPWPAPLFATCAQGDLP